MRYFIKLQYLGTHFHGWQSQPNSRTVQGDIEAALKKLYKVDIPIVGCGRTDTGVHASDYIAHFDSEELDKEEFLFKMNKVLSREISIRALYPIHEEAHARFDAFERSYLYKMTFRQNPFLSKLQYYYPYSKKPSFDLMNEAASILKNGTDFKAFRKVGSDVKSDICSMNLCEWNEVEEGMELSISANRFLRGMVRLIVGATINVGLEKISMDEFREAVQHQKSLSINWSVPAEGLALTAIKYPFDLI